MKYYSWRYDFAYFCLQVKLSLTFPKGIRKKFKKKSVLISGNSHVAYSVLKMDEAGSLHQYARLTDLFISA